MTNVHPIEGDPSNSLPAMHTTEYCPSGPIFDAINIEFGLYDTSILESSYAPTQRSREIADKVIELAYQPDSSVRLVFGLQPEAGNWSADTRFLYGLRRILGPDNLQEILGDVDAAYLWESPPQPPVHRRLKVSA